jgi:hypothetical protein
MFMQTGANGGHIGAVRGIGRLGLVAALALSACGGGASSAPTSGPGQSGATSSGTPGATQPATTGTAGESGSPQTGGTAFSGATAALDALDSYEFKVEIKSTTVSGSDTTASHTILSGVVENKPDKASSLMSQDLDADGNVTSSTGIVIIGQQAWIQSGTTWQAVPVAQADVFVQAMASFRPEQMFGLYFAGIGGDFTAVGSETKNGVASTHFSGDQNVGTLLGTIAGFQGTWTSDVWIANDGGYLVHSEAGGTAATGADQGSYLISVDISKPNAAGTIQPPS